MVLAALQYPPVQMILVEPVRYARGRLSPVSYTPETTKTWRQAATQRALLEPDRGALSRTRLLHSASIRSASAAGSSSESTASS